MERSTLVLLVTMMAINSGHFFPTTDFIKPNTPENIERLNNLDPNDLAYLYSGQFEGDIVISEEELEAMFNGRGGRSGLIDERYRWTDNIVPYEINETQFTTAQINYITLGVQKIMDVTCLKFVKYNPAIHRNYVYVTGEDSGCWSYVGMQGGRQRLNLQSFAPESGCFRLYTIVHEFIHAIGFFHMQSATERDDYVEIIWDNIQNGTRHNFEKFNASVVSQYGVEYDYGSVMHYPATAFSINGEPTIRALRDLGGEVMGQQVRMSEKDIARINAKYCPKINNRPRNLTEFFRQMNKRMNNLFRLIF